MSEDYVVISGKLLSFPIFPNPSVNICTLHFNFEAKVMHFLNDKKARLTQVSDSHRLTEMQARLAGVSIVFLCLSVINVVRKKS